MRGTGRKAREVDLAEFDLKDLEALDPSATGDGEQKVVSTDTGNIQGRHRLPHSFYRARWIKTHA